MSPPSQLYKSWKLATLRTLLGIVCLEHACVLSLSQHQEIKLSQQLLLVLLLFHTYIKIQGLLGINHFTQDNHHITLQKVLCFLEERTIYMSCFHVRSSSSLPMITSRCKAGFAHGEGPAVFRNTIIIVRPHVDPLQCLLYIISLAMQILQPTAYFIHQVDLERFTFHYQQSFENMGHHGNDQFANMVQVELIPHSQFFILFPGIMADAEVHKIPSKSCKLQKIWQSMGLEIFTPFEVGQCALYRQISGIFTS